MKVVSSVKGLKNRHFASRLIKRKGRIYIINKLFPKYKAVQK